MSHTNLLACVLSAAVLGLAAISCAPVSGATLEVRLTVTETAGVARKAEPVTTGVPFAKGAVKDAAKLRLFDAKGTAWPVDFHVLSPWPDGSVRVALMNFLADVPANGKATFTLKDSGGARPKPDGAVTMAQMADPVMLSNGTMKIAVGAQKAPALIRGRHATGAADR